MADLLLSALIPVVLKKATASVFQRIGEMWGIDDQRERLHNMLLEIQAVLPNAEEQANSNTAVKSWLQKLESAAYEADDLLDEFCYEELRQDAVRRGHKVDNVSAFFSLENPALLRYNMSGRLKKVSGRLHGLVDQMRKFGFIHGHRVPVVNRIKTDSLVVESKVVGRDDDIENVVRLLIGERERDDLTVVPIVGMGGLGKTTLTRQVFNDTRVTEYFNLQLWVCVSKEFNIAHLVKSIIELEKECNLPIDNMELLQRHLRQLLSEKRYILVLDDVWNENVDEWEHLRALLKCGDSGSAIIVTTRSGRVATIMGTVGSYDLECLGEEDSWSLFQKRAFSMGVKECQELVEIGRKMVQNCQGLPLAINTLGSLMSYKSEVREWRDVLEESRIWEQRPAKDYVLPVLRLSYDHLPSDMKQCFAFCAVYPKNYEMDKDKLIQFWMANGFIPSEVKGSSVFNELAWGSFFQEVKQVCPIIDLRIKYLGEDSNEEKWGQEYCSETKCKMHDLMHDLAQSIMGAKCLSISEIPAELNQPMIDVHHISIKTPALDINKAIYCFPSVQSLISSCPALQYVKNIGFLKSNSLRILELNVWPIDKTIITPKKMKHLRYLEISIMDITSLPETISSLYLLQTLKISECPNLEKLPEGMRYMSSLRHLIISGPFCNLRSMPKGLGQLNYLQILTIYTVGTEAGNGIRELNNLNNLHGRLHLYNLGKIKNVVDAREANLIAKQNLDDLALCWGMPRSSQSLQEANAPEVMHCNPFEVLEALKPGSRLKVLRIEEYSGNMVPVWMTEYHMLENLIELYIIKCRECTKIPPLEKLPFLRVLTLKHLDNLRHLCNSASTSLEGGEAPKEAFPLLKNLVLSELPELCSWCEGEVGNKSSLTFPELKELKVINCPKLTAVPIVPLLMSMTVRGNKNLSCFATGLTTLHDLSLESDGGNESLSFQPWESLNFLELRKFNSIVPVGAMEGEESITPTKCRRLFFSKVSNIPSNKPLWFWKCFAFLKILEIRECDSLIYWPKEEFRSLNCLCYIHVSKCPNFLGTKTESTVGSSITEVLLPIEVLIIDACPNLVEIPNCSTSIQALCIFSCPKLEGLPEWLGSMIPLKLMQIADCESLNSLALSMGGLSSMGCPNLAYLPERMEGFKALEQLTIERCPKIRVLPEGMLQQLKNLNKLWIVGCPHLERQFRKYGKYHHLISGIRVTKFGEERRSDILKNLVQSITPCKITRFSAQS